MSARCRLRQYRQDSLRLQKDTGLALVIEGPVQAACVEIEEHGGLLVASALSGEIGWA